MMIIKKIYDKIDQIYLVLITFMLLGMFTVDLFNNIYFVRFMYSRTLLLFFIFLLCGLLIVSILYGRFFIQNIERIKQVKVIKNTNSVCLSYDISSTVKDEEIFEIKSLVNVKPCVFDHKLKDKINQVKSDLKLSNKTDLAILFLYVQHFVLDERISNSEIIRQINSSFEFELFSKSYYSQKTIDLFEWNGVKPKKMNINNVSKHSSYYEIFNKILENF